MAERTIFSVGPAGGEKIQAPAMTMAKTSTMAIVTSVSVIEGADGEGWDFTDADLTTGPFRTSLDGLFSPQPPKLEWLLLPPQLLRAAEDDPKPPREAVMARDDVIARGEMDVREMVPDRVARVET